MTLSRSTQHPAKHGDGLMTSHVAAKDHVRLYCKFFAIKEMMIVNNDYERKK